jgi:pyruvate kinase
VAEEDGQSSHAAIVGGALDIPVIVGAENATHLLKNGTIVTVDAAKGFVSSTAGCPI